MWPSHEHLIICNNQSYGLKKPRKEEVDSSFQVKKKNKITFYF